MNEQQLADSMADGLRLLATMIEENPEVADNFRSTLQTSGINVHLRSGEPAAEMANIARIARRYGATTTKDISPTMHNVACDFGTVKFDILAFREEVCERVVIGTETVTKTVKDPAVLATVPDVEVTETVEKVEWVCKPLLAAEQVNA
jgi:uncharacterized protein related to proFAR isomerase